MKKLVVHNEKLTKEAAEELLDICKFGAIDYDEKNNKIEINAACKTCGLCVRKGSYGVCEMIIEEGAKTIIRRRWRKWREIISLSVYGLPPQRSC